METPQGWSGFAEKVLRTFFSNLLAWFSCEAMAEELPSLREQLEEVYQRLYSCYGPQHWWPADDPFEVVVGAILTQAAAWGNVEKAISNLKGAGALSPGALRQLPLDQLADLIYPCGYYKAKALKLKSFVQRLGQGYSDRLDWLLALDVHRLRSELLSIYGIGQETADSITLYAARKPIFVVDGYTRRIFGRLGLRPAKDSYPAFQALFMDSLPADEQLFNEYHALLVRHGKEVCRRVPLCDHCCLSPGCTSLDFVI